MRDLRFVRLGDTGLQVEELRVAWDGSAHVFTLKDARGLAGTADHENEKAPEVLDDSPLQLVGE